MSTTASLPAFSKAYTLTQPGSYRNLIFSEVAIPELGAKDVLVKIHAVSLQYRDLMVAAGKYGPDLAPNLVPCSDMAGEVIAVGAEVQKWTIGDRVCANFFLDLLNGYVTPQVQKSALGALEHGVLTQYRKVPAHSLVAIPEHLSYEEASTLPCAALTAYNALYGPVPLKAGDTVLVLGTGGVSMHTLQLATAAGATVIATSSSDKKLEIATKLGAKHIINYNRTPDWHEEVLRITRGRGVDHLIEVGGGTLLKSIAATRTGGGQIHIIGHVASMDAALPSVIPVISKAVTLRGLQVGSVAQFEDMNRLLSANPEVTRPLVDKVFEFEQALDAYAYLESQQHVGKVVIRVSKD